MVSRPIPNSPTYGLSVFGFDRGYEADAGFVVQPYWLNSVRCRCYHPSRDGGSKQYGVDRRRVSDETSH